MNDLISAVKKYASENYNSDGWDYVVETMGDSDIEDILKNPLDGPSATTVDEAIKAVGAVVKLWDDRRRDIMSTAF